MSDISISQGSKLSIGTTDADFIGVGTSMFLLVVVALNYGIVLAVDFLLLTNYLCDSYFYA